jgi:Raf kinase inhibitor-like YbhB/YbcL family protein
MLTALLAALALHATAFEANAPIPARYTCQGEDATPVLSVSDVPSGAKTLALVVDDPDAPDPAAPKRTWVHWVVYDLPPRAGEISPGAGRAGKGDEGKTVWRGPCPPVGRHRYFFKLYALDEALGDRGALTKSELEKAMEGHILEKTELVGTYEKTK